MATPRPRYRSFGKGISAYYKKDYTEYLDAIHEAMEKTDFKELVQVPDFNEDGSCGKMVFNWIKAVFSKKHGIKLVLKFYMPRPKSHYGTGRNSGKIKASAPGYADHRSKPDLDNLIKGVMDGLTGALYEDDSQVRIIEASKHYINEYYPDVGIYIGWELC